MKNSGSTIQYRIMAMLLILLSATAVLLTSSCEGLGGLTEVAAGVGVATGQLSSSEAEAISKSAKAVEKSAEDITPEQTYYIGRAVGAQIMDNYDPYVHTAATDYINALGQSLALASDRPELFGGYRFLILDSDEINAFAAPSGHIFLTRGIINLAETEDGLAAILAHEISHVVLEHGLKSIKTSRITAAFSSVAMTSVQLASSSEIAELTEVFEDSINDITQTLVTNGYSRASEAEADRGAVEIMKRVGYDPRALVEVLEAMDKVLEPGGLDFAKTHPDPKDRIEVVKKEIGNWRPGQRNEAAMRRRFSAFKRNL